MQKHAADAVSIYESVTGSQFNTSGLHQLLYAPLINAQASIIRCELAKDDGRVPDAANIANAADELSKLSTDTIVYTYEDNELLMVRDTMTEAFEKIAPAEVVANVRLKQSGAVLQGSSPKHVKMSQ